MQTLHVVSHTHWDREWYQTFQQFRLKLVQLVDDLLEMLDRDPDYKHFMLDGQTIVLDDYLLMRPEKETALREHIRAGRILVGPWHILPDMFLVGPEAHIRNLLEGDGTARKFGPKMMVGYMPDSFGHIGQMPQILRGFDIETACLWRGLDEEPAEFWWQSGDGSRVLMAYLRDSYSNGASLPAGEAPTDEGLARFAGSLAERGRSLAEHSGACDVLVMLGTDHMPPPRHTGANIAAASGLLKDTRVLHSSLPRYLAALQETLKNTNLPVVQGELRSCKRMHLLPGVLSTRIWIKQRNTASENLLTKWVEPFSTFVELAAETSPQNQPAAQRLRQPGSILRQAWRLLMENHPHDSICGCSIDQVHAEMKVRFDQVDQIGEELTRQSLESLAESTNTQSAAPQPLSALIVYNPSPFARTDLASAEFGLPLEASAFEILDENGRSLPYETLGLGRQELINISMNPQEFRAAFGTISAGRVNGLGIRAFKVQRNGSNAHLDIILTEGEPDLAVWERGVEATLSLLADAGISSFQVRACSADLVRVIFSAPDIPALGWRSFCINAKTGQSPPLRLSRLARAVLPLAGRLAGAPLGRMLIERLQREPANKPPYSLENDFFIVDLEAAGTISILDKANGVIYHGMQRFVDGGDCGDEYNYSAPPVDPQFVAHLLDASIQRGSARQVLTLRLLIKTPAALSGDRKSRSRETVETRIKTIVSLANGVARIDIHTEIENQAKDHRLRAHFPAPFRLETADYDGHFEVIRRKIGIPAYDRRTWVEDPRPEVPQRAFTELSDEKRGLTLANRGLPEVEVLKSGDGMEIALTLLRCVGWLSRDDFQTRRGHAGPGVETPGAQMPGGWQFDYAIIPHGGQNQPFHGARQAYAFETPLRCVATSIHQGSLPGKGSFLAVESAGVDNSAGTFTLTAVKQVGNGGGWLARGYNPGTGTIRVTLTPFKRFKSAARLNLAEQKLSDLALTGAAGSVSFPVNSQEIVTVWFGE